MISEINGPDEGLALDVAIGRGIDDLRGVETFAAAVEEEGV